MPHCICGSQEHFNPGRGEGWRGLAGKAADRWWVRWTRAGDRQEGPAAPLALASIGGGLGEQRGPERCSAASATPADLASLPRHLAAQLALMSPVFHSTGRGFGPPGERVWVSVVCVCVWRGMGWVGCEEGMSSQLLEELSVLSIENYPK